MQLIWFDQAWTDYTSWIDDTPRLVFRVNHLIDDIRHGRCMGVPLQANQWSRRIDDEHRLIYQIRENCIEILSCRGHYED